ncbi:peptide ABC transporter substrate-binding protein [Levilactobacillus acidifarinae]|nr:peptide ABC transporter substrate-binding protein [Levilactobacillus acidifarinae]GEO68813.1 peptide ABC transporter substrate-binding protein [Levilactobacillus acidifarinae]
MKVSAMVKLGTVATLAAALLAACGNSASPAKSSTAQAKDQTLTWMESSSLTSMDNSLATDIISGETLNNTGAGLLKFGAGNKTYPSVATRYTKSKDGKTYTFYLRHSKWSNGQPVTAKDFVYGWQRTVNPKTGSQYSYLYADVKNDTAISKGKAPASDLGVKAEGNYKLVVNLVHPISYFPTLVAQVSFFPQNKSVVQKYGKGYAANAQNNVYNGPFKLTYWTGTSDNWTLTKNPDYWDAKGVKLHQLKFSAVKDPQTALSQYQSGKLDAIYLTGQQPRNLKSNPGYRSLTSARAAYVEMNEKHDSLMRDTKARQALSLAINCPEFTKKVLADGSIPATGIVTKGLATYKGKDFATEATDPSATAYDQAKAKKLWAEALKETGRKSYNMTLMSDDTPVGKSTTEYLQSEWSKLPGLKVTNQNIPYKTRLARSAAGQFDVVVSLWGADFPDPITDLQLFTSGNTYNNGKWSNQAYDNLIKKVTTTDANNPDKRWTEMVSAQKILLQNEGIIPLYQGGKPQLLKSKVKDVVYYPIGANWDFSHAYISK